jgi:hypothetical protein
MKKKKWLSLPLSKLFNKRNRSLLMKGELMHAFLLEYSKENNFLIQEILRK